MSELAYKNHPIRGLISQINEIESNKSFYAPNIAENEQFSYSRDKIFATTKVIEAYLNQTPAVLASIHGLNQLNSSFQNVVNETNSFIGDKNTSHLVNAANNIDANVLPQLWSFLPRLHELTPSIFSEISEKLRNTSLSTIQELENEKRLLSENIAELKTEISNQKKSLDTLGELLNSQKTEAQVIVANLQKDFAESEAKRSSEFNQKITTFDLAYKNYEENAIEKKDGLLSALQKSQNDASRIVEVIGDIGTTGKFQKIANSETDQADLWRWITIGLFALGIGGAIATFIKFWGEPFSPENAFSALIRLLYAMAITAPAWYAAKESARHRTNADRARQTELELASIGPFIELLPQEKKNQIRETLVPMYFGKGVDPHEVGDSPLKDFKEIAIEAIKAIPKK